MKGTFYGIGVGPGDPELLTCKAVRILKEVPWVATPVAERDRESTAFKIARPYISPHCRILEIDFPMIRDKASLEEAWREACAAVRQVLDRGEAVAFLTLGDPMLYSTYIYLYRQLRSEGYSTLTVPGITSFCAAAAAGGMPIAFGDEKVALLSGAAVCDFEDGDLENFETLVIFKVSSCYDRVVTLLERAGRLENSIMVISCSHAEEEVVTDLRAMIGKKLSYFSLVISRKEPF